MSKTVDIEQIDFEIGKDINKLFEDNSKHKIEPNMLDYLIGDPEKTEELSKILKELYNECYYILLNIGTTFNEEWSKEHNIYTKEIDLNTDRVESYNENDEVRWSLY